MAFSNLIDIYNLRYKYNKLIEKELVGVSFPDSPDEYRAFLLGLETSQKVLQDCIGIKLR